MGSFGVGILTFLVVIILVNTLDLVDGENVRQSEKQILDSILGGDYDSRIRPSGLNITSSEKDPPCVVRVNMFIRTISNIDDVNMEYTTQITFRQQWVDERLRYDDRDGMIPYLVLTDPDKIWKPDIFFSNEKRGHFHNIIMPNVLLRIYPNGEVLFSMRISLVLACPMDLSNFPFDKQTCYIRMASYGYTTNDLVFVWKEGNPIQLTSSLSLPRFNLIQVKTEYCTSRTATGDYSCLRADLAFKRELSYYLIQVYIPCIMLVITSWVSFWLDPKATTARVFLGIITLLTLTTFVSSVNNNLPPVSYTKSIDIWTGMCLTFVFASLIEFALVHFVYVRQSRSGHGNTRSGWLTAHAIDIACRVIFPILFGIFFVLYWGVYFIKQIDTEGQD